MARERNDLIDWLQYIALRTVSMLLHWWPIDLNLQTAKLLGNFIYAVDRKHRERALANLRRSFPNLSEKELDTLAQRSMQSLFQFFVEVLFTVRLLRIDTFAKYIELENFEQSLRLLLQKDHGLIMISGHYGNFEILGYAMATLGFETHSVFRPLDNPYINEYMAGVRGRMGQKIIAKKGATQEVTDVLDRNGVVCFVADQNAGSKGLFVDFFGRKASTYKSIGLLAMEYNVPVVIGYSRRLGDRFRFKVGVQDVIWPKDWENQDDPLRYITQRYSTAMENFIRKDPGQYWWVHRRWKSRPKGEAPEAYD